jgi:uncharacterized protein
MPPARQAARQAAATAFPWRVETSCLLLRVRLTPKGGRDAIEGCVEASDGPALKARVRAAPENGAANAALEALIADWVGVPRRDVALAGGAKSRTKTLALSGDPSALAVKLCGLIERL